MLLIKKKKDEIFNLILRVQFDRSCKCKEWFKIANILPHIGFESNFHNPIKLDLQEFMYIQYLYSDGKYIQTYSPPVYRKNVCLRNQSKILKLLGFASFV